MIFPARNLRELLLASLFLAGLFPGNLFPAGLIPDEAHSGGDMAHLRQRPDSAVEHNQHRDGLG
jgi:hypothetical protein